MNDRSIKSAERTLALFELFSVRQQQLTVGDVSKSLDVPQPSVSMLLRNLTRLGYLEYDPVNRRYGPTVRVGFLNTWLTARYPNVGLLAPALSVLLSDVNETVFLGMQNGARAQYILSMDPQKGRSILIQSGMLRSLTCSAMGRALLSLRPDDEIRRWIRRCNSEETDERFLTTESDFLELVARTRRLGYAETAGDVTPGFGAIAMAIKSPIGGQPLALGAGSTIERLAEKRDAVIEALNRARRSLEEKA